MTNYITISQDDFKKTIARDIVAREQELFSYEINITYYTNILQSLPVDEWPPHLKKAKTAPKDEAQAEQIALYLYRDQITQRLLSERIERSRSLLSYNTMLALLPEGEREALVLEAKKLLK